MVKIYTAQYRYSGPNRLDITTRSKSFTGLVFSPRWEMVRDYKQTGNEEAYKEKYHQLILESYKNNRAAWDEVLNMEEVVLVCFCAPNNFCHRYLVANYLVQLGGEYYGEIPNK